MKYKSRHFYLSDCFKLKGVGNLNNESRIVLFNRQWNQLCRPSLLEAWAHHNLRQLFRWQLLPTSNRSKCLEASFIMSDLLLPQQPVAQLSQPVRIPVQTLSLYSKVSNHFLKIVIMLWTLFKNTGPCWNPDYSISAESLNQQLLQKAMK